MGRRFKTPTTKRGLSSLDSRPVEEALACAWVEPGFNPAWHREARTLVRDAMPVLARQLDRMVDQGLASGKGRHRA